MYDIITIGSATRDAFVRSPHFRIVADHDSETTRSLAMSLGAKLELEKIVFSTGGGATNTAVTFRKQGFRTACMGVVGDDISGHTVLKELQKEDISTDFMHQHKTLPTGYSLLLHASGGERTVLVYRGASETLTPDMVQWDNVETQWIYCSSLAGNMELLGRVVAHAEDRNIRVAYNPGGKELDARDALIPLLQHIGVLIVNREEAARITGASFDDELAIFRAWDALTPGRNINVMTDARNGVMVSDGELIYHAGIYEEKSVEDRTGAGDAFGSGFVSGLMQRAASKNADWFWGEDDISYAIRLGSANATAKVEGVGAKFGLLTKKEFEEGTRWRDLEINVQRI
jgi:sugar/nucleoside kinase (ribokinase family)